MSLALAPAGLTGPVARLRDAAWAGLAAQHGRFAPWLSVALGLGVLGYFGATEEPDPAILWLVPPLLLAAVAFGRRAPLGGWLLGLGAAGLLGFGAAAWHAARMPPALVLPATAVQLSGTVQLVEALAEGRRVTLRAPRLDAGPPLERTLRVRLRAEDPARPAPGDTLAVRALVRAPSGPAVPDGWDFGRAAFFSGLGGSGFALGPAEVTAGPGGGAPIAALRQLLSQRIAASIPGEAGAIAVALLTGSQAAIPAPAMAAMRDSGLAHLLSVSGLHMTIVMGTTFATLRLLVALVPFVALRVPGKPAAALGALAAGAFYMLLTGAQVPMQRSFAMAALVTLALLAGRRALSLRALAIAAAVVLLAAPAELLGPSFQMSFAAVLGLIAGHEALRARLAAFRAGGGAWRRAMLVVGGLALTSLLAGAATAPFGLHHFGRLQLFGVLANALAVPVTSLLVMPAGMVALLLVPLGLDQPAFWAMGLGIEGILVIARLVAGLPGASPILPPLPGPALGLAAFGFCWLCLWRGGLRLPGLALLLGALAAGFMARPPDVLVAADARQVALRTEAGVFLHRQPGADSFTRDAMLRRLGATAWQPLPETGEAADGAIACTPAACRFRPRPDGPEAVLLRTAPPPRGARRGEPPDAATLAAACGHVALVVATEPIRRACTGTAVTDRFTLWRNGATAAWLEGSSARIETAAARRGDRPWVPDVRPGRPEPLPMAPRDPGGAAPTARD